MESDHQQTKSITDIPNPTEKTKETPPSSEEKTSSDQQTTEEYFTTKLQKHIATYV